LFGTTIEDNYGPRVLLIIYFSAILGGSLLSLAIHRHHDYRALGASGGVCGVIFASIFLVPGMAVMSLYFPVGIPGWLYAILYLAGSFWAYHRRRDNIGHDAHMGGAIIGLLVATVMYPEMVSVQPWMFAAVLSLSTIILVTLIGNPLQLLGQAFSEEPGHFGGERGRRYAENRRRNEKTAQLDKLLDKVAKNGIHSLSTAERKTLNQLSRELHGDR
jgi:hypothetical protein